MKKHCSGIFAASIRPIHKHLFVPLLFTILGMSTAAVAAPGNRAPTITLVYATAETTTSASVVWNTNVASDSHVQYSTNNPIPASAPARSSAALVTYHEFSLTGLTPDTLYYYKVTSCNKRGCTSATGSFETFPDCPDTVPGVSGSWQKANSQSVSGTSSLDQELLGIAAISDNDVWTVGWAQDPAGPQYAKRSLVEHFDGTAWSIVRSPNPPNDTTTQLYSVSAASANDVWAVGQSHNGTLPSRTLIERWDGTQWTIVPSPSPADQLNALQGVAAVSANDVWAVGYTSGSQTQSPIDTLILHWNGASWTRVPSPNVAGVANQLFGISAISASDIWAVGYAGGLPLSMHWNGSAWSIVSVPRGSGLSSDYLTAVSGAASNDVWAVGKGQGIFSNQRFATIRHWDGSRWTEKVCRAASSSNPPDGYEGGGPDAYFTGVSAAATNDVWAVGVRGSGPMILHWDGVAWTAVIHPRAFPNSATPRAVTTLRDGKAWSAGQEIEINVAVRTLVYMYNP
jgi:hypothetical protein